MTALKEKASGLEASLEESRKEVRELKKLIGEKDKLIEESKKERGRLQKRIIENNQKFPAKITELTQELQRKTEDSQRLRDDLEGRMKQQAILYMEKQAGNKSNLERLEQIAIAQASRIKELEEALVEQAAAAELERDRALAMVEKQKQTIKQQKQELTGRQQTVESLEYELGQTEAALNESKQNLTHVQAEYVSQKATIDSIIQSGIWRPMPAYVPSQQSAVSYPLPPAPVFR